MQFSIPMWNCCGRSYSTGIMACKVCKKPQPVYGINDDNDPPERASKPIPKHKRYEIMDDSGNESFTKSCIKFK